MRPRRVLVALDLVAAAVAVIVSWIVPVEAVWSGPPLSAGARYAHAVIIGAVAVATLAVNAWTGGYSSRRRVSRIDDSLLLLRNLGLAALGIAAAALVTKGFGAEITAFSRRVIVAETGLFLLLLGLGRVAMWSWQRRMFLRGAGVRHVIVAGVGASAHSFERFLGARRWLGVRCAGAVEVLDHATELQRHGGLPLAAPIVGGLDDIVRVVRETRAGEVIVALDDDEMVAFPDVARTLVRADVPFRIMPTLFEASYAHACAAGLDGLPTVAVQVEFLDEAQLAVKRVSDVLLSSAVLILSAPLFALVALAVKLTSRGPVLFRQERLGLDGRRFRMLKFRSMCADAEARLGELGPLNEADGALFKIKDDPRITPVGRFLRRWSIDELPQFINVLRGEMSVVGPRPPLPREVEVYETPQLARLKGKPGITGLWQVSGRSDLTFAQMVDLDRHYLEHWSLRLDLSIMLRTALAIVKRSGAY